MSKFLVPALCNVMHIKSYTRFHLRYLSFLELNNMICESSSLCKCRNNSLSSLWGMFDTNSYSARPRDFLSGSKFVWNVGIEWVSIVWEKGNWQFLRVVERMSQTKGYTVMSHVTYVLYKYINYKYIFRLICCGERSGFWSLNQSPTFI